MDNITDFFAEPLHLSPLAQARWLAFKEAVPRELEVYAFVLCDPSAPTRIANCYLPAQTVTGGSCRVNAEDVKHAGEVARRAGLRVAGSIHRHPFRSSSLSSIDDDLLDFMAHELGSELASPVRMTRRPNGLVIRANGRRLRSESGKILPDGVYLADNDVEIEETVPASRIYCLMWSSEGYFGKVARVIYDPATGRHQTVRSLDSQIVLEDGVDRQRIDRERIARLAERIVRRSYPATTYSYREADRCCYPDWWGRGYRKYGYSGD